MFPERLLWRTEPLEDELLSSYLWRLGQLNFFEPPDLIWTLVGVRRPSSNLLAQPEVFRALSRLTGQGVDTLFKLSLHPLAERLSTSETPLERFNLEPEPGFERAWVTHRGHRLAVRSERKV